MQRDGRDSEKRNQCSLLTKTMTRNFIISLVTLYMTVASVAGQGLSGPGLLWTAVSIGPSPPSHLLFIRGGAHDIYTNVSHNATVTANQLLTGTNAFLTGLAYDYHDNYIFTIDTVGKLVYRNDLAAGSIGAIHGGVSGRVEGMAVDWLANKLYWTDASYNWIMVSDYNGQYALPLIYRMLDRPRGITVHPFKGYLYWCDLGSNRKIERSTLNGERRETIVSIETHGSYFIQSPSGLSIDYAENRLYWTDDGLNTVMSIDLDSPLEISEFYPGLRSVLLLPFDLTMDQDFVVVGDFSSTRLWLIDRGNQSITGWLAFNFHPIGVTYYTEWRQQTQQSPCSTNNGGCDQLCVSDPNGHKCLCSHGYVLDDDGKTCTVDNHQVPGHQILFSTSNSICRLPVTFGHAVVPVSENCFVQDVNATAMDYVYRQDALYVHDQLTGSIRKMTLREGETFVTIVQGVSGVKGIAVDWLGSNLYWTDAESKAIFVSKLNGLHVTKLITENIENPRDIAVHSIKKILFWADSGSYPRIEKSMLSGRDRDVVLTDNTTLPVALTIDYQRDRLYWYDANSGMIHSTSFDGKSQQPLVAGRVNLFGMDVFQDHLFWTEPDQNTITDFDLVSNSTVRIQSMSDSPEALIVFDKTIQTEESGPCDMFNGGCAEICVPTELGAECLCSQPQSASCRKVVRCPVDFYGGSIAPGCDNVNGNICPFICKNNFSPRLTGTLLCQDDGQWDTTLWILCKTDIILSDFLLVADTQGKIFHIDMQSPSLDYISLPLRDLLNPIAIDFDVLEERVYWTDVNKKTINRASLDGIWQEEILSANVDIPDGLALDIDGRKLYWTDTGRNTIERANLDGSVRELIVWQSLDEPRAIFVDKEKEHLYWSDWGSAPKIERSNLDGRNRETLVSTDLGWPNGLTLDKTDGKLYWCDGQTERIEYLVLHSNVRRVLISFGQGLAHTFSLSVVGDYIYWTDWTQNRLQRADKATGKNITSVGYAIFNRANDVHYFEMPTFTVVRCPVDFFGGTIDHDCTNTKGSSCNYKCNAYYRAVYGGTLLCQEDGQWHVDTSTICELDIPNDDFFLVADSQGTIFYISMTLPQMNYVKLPLGNVHNPVALDFDLEENKVYWTDVAQKTISRASFDGTEYDVILSVDIEVPDGLALDLPTRKLYWTDTGTNRIERANLDGSNRQVVISTNITEPRAIIVGNLNNYIFWTDWGIFPKIERANLDGSSRQTLIDTELGWPNGLVLDKEEQKLYWCDALLNRIEYYDLIQNARQLMVTFTEPVHPFSLAIVGDYVYWTDWTHSQLRRANKRSGQDISSVGNAIFYRANDLHFYTRTPTTGLTTVASTTPTTSTKRATDKPVTTIKSTTATTVRLTTSHDTVRAQTSRSRSMPSTTMGLWTSKSVSTTATTVVTTHDLTTARGTQSFQTPSGRLNTSGQQTSQKYSEITSHHVHQDTTQQNGRGNVSPTVTALPVTSDPTTLIKTTIDPGPSFTKCPENENFEFQVGAEVNYAVIDNITIEAVNGKGDPIDYTISANVQIPGHMEFQVLPIHVIVLASAGEKQAHCRFTIKTIDKHPPRIKCPSSKSITTRQSSKEVYWNDPIVTDNVEARLQWTSREIGSTFPVGNTSVTASAIDSSGNMADCSFWVNILHNQGTCDDLFPQNGGLVCGQNTLALLECILYCQSGYKPSPNIVVFTCFDGDWIPPNEYPGCAEIRTPASISIQVKFTYEGVCEKSEDIIIMVVEKLMEEIDHHDLCSVHGARVCNSENLRWHCGTGRKRLAGDDLVLEFRVETTANLTNYGDLPNQGVDVATTTEEMERTLNESIAKFEEFVKGGNFSVDVNGTIYDVDTESFTVGKLVKTCLLGHANTPFGCLACAIGTFYNSSINECLPCDVNTYQDSEAQLGCKKCEDGQYTERAGSYTRYQCLEKPEENPTKSGGLQALYLVVICVSAALIFVIVLASVTCLACRRKPKPRSRNLII